MEPMPKNKPESRFKHWLNRLFCMGEQQQPHTEVMKRPDRVSKTIKRHKVHMSLLGSYKISTLCKVSRRNFVVDSIDNTYDRLPATVCKYLGEKIGSITAVVYGDISPKLTKRIVSVIRVVGLEETGDGECIKADIGTLRLRCNDLCIYHPKVTSGTSHTAPEEICRQILGVVSNFKNSVMILPKDIILDEIGILLAPVNKFIEIETIVANGIPLCLVVYVGTKEFVLISDQEQIEFVVKELKKDLSQDDPNINQLVRKILQRSSVSDLLFLLRKSINEAYVDTILSCFLRNALCKQLVTSEEVGHMFPTRNSEMEDRHTPSLRLTARFNFTVSQNFKHTCSDDLLNGANGQMLFQNEIETFAESELSMKGLELIADYNPYDHHQ